MPLSNPASREEINARDTALHRRKRLRNLAIMAALLALMAAFYLVTIVRIQAGLEAAQLEISNGKEQTQTAETDILSCESLVSELYVEKEQCQQNQQGSG